MHCEGVQGWLRMCIGLEGDELGMAIQRMMRVFLPL